MNDKNNNPYEVTSTTLDAIGTVVDDGVVSENTLKQIRNAWIAACISGAITLVITLFAMTGNAILGFSALQLIDVVLIFGLAFGIRKKSRICAVAMLLYFLASKIILIQQSGAAGVGGILGFVFLYYYGYGVIGTFAYHKVIRETRDAI